MGQLNHLRWDALTPKINGQLHLDSGTVTRIGRLDRGNSNVLLQQCGPTSGGDPANLVFTCIYRNRLSAGKLWKIRHEIVTSVDLVEWLPIYADTENTMGATVHALSDESVAANKILLVEIHCPTETEFVWRCSVLWYKGPLSAYVVNIDKDEPGFNASHIHRQNAARRNPEASPCFEQCVPDRDGMIR